LDDLTESSQNSQELIDIRKVYTALIIYGKCKINKNDDIFSIYFFTITQFAKAGTIIFRKKRE